MELLATLVWDQLTWNWNTFLPNRSEFQTKYFMDIVQVSQNELNFTTMLMYPYCSKLELVDYE